MKRIKIIASIILLAGGLALHAQEEYSSGLRIVLVLEKRMYYSNEDVNLKIVVKNISGKKNTFLIYDSDELGLSQYTTFQPVVFDRKGHEAETLVSYRTEKIPQAELLRGLTPRAILLGANESYIHTVNLKQLYSLNAETAYRVKGFFFPDFEKEKVIHSDNELSFRISRSPYEVRKPEKKSVSRDISPSESVILMLTAEKKGQWEKYFKYIDTEKYITSYSDFVGRYNRADAEERARIEEEFIQYLARERDDYILDFKVQKEDVDNERNLAYVYARVDRSGIRITRKFRYKFTLEKGAGNLWLVTGLEAKVVKGTKR